MEWKNYLRNKNIKITKGRIKILDILNKADKALNVQEIYDYCKNCGLNMDLSTVYRSIDLFEHNNILDKVDLGDGKYRYKVKCHNHKHILKCCICHKEIEIDCPMTQVEELIKNETGFVLVDHELKLKAMCKDCISKHNNNQ